ncbi:MAG: carbamoyltransferase HypF [Candidatus Bathyarchaeota archaeon]|nr:carbamoyltransferase HypF [Candidatus Bathyarchaeota archaeon]
MKVNITGIVQGVGFRPFVYRVAVQNSLAGYVRNRGDAGVEILLEGKEQNIQNFLRVLKEKKPSLSQIHDVITTTLTGKNQHDKFNIYKSSEETQLSGSIIPPDIAICNDCLTELRDPKDPRYEYFFITCTNCGPRFTLIKRLPYDRENTTMREFPMCSFCQQEYTNPLNRRFHAQTVACPTCGPKAYLTTSDGKKVRQVDPVREAGKLLNEGAILAIKGYGGFHVATSATREEPLQALRKAKHRRAKPFAIMARSLEATKDFAEVTSKEEALLSSYARPIVLLNKSSAYSLSPLVAPNLHNVGVMLPYTALHYMLFDRVDDFAFVMTSANPPNQPIVKENDEALRTLGDTVDYFLFHNREIAYRCDDSVLRVHGTHPSFIRRSRGYAPAPLMLKEKARRCVIGLGGELNNTSCVLLANKAFISQHIGDVENVETRTFLQEATNHLIRLTISRVDAVTCDLHPKFTTTHLAQELAETNGWQLIQAQHHYTHVAALMMEHAVDELVGITCDGYGYGVDGDAWGGEILFCTRESKGFKRLAHLEKQPLLGGDMSTRYPLRIAAGMLSKKVNLEPWLLEHSERLLHGETEAKLILQQLQKGVGATDTTSCGRVLDAVASVLGVCYERTYEGEPAIKLESAAIGGKDVLNMKPIIDGNVLDTGQMLHAVFEKLDEAAVADLAYSAHAYLARGLASIAVEQALEQGVNAVGFSGGAACNQILEGVMRRIVEAAGLKFLVHEAVPAGDGGISFGQAVVGGFFSV